MQNGEKKKNKEKEIKRGELVDSLKERIKVRLKDKDEIPLPKREDLPESNIAPPTTELFVSPLDQLPRL